MDKKTYYKSLTVGESLEDQSADKLIMLMCQGGWYNFKQIAVVWEQQDICCLIQSNQDETLGPWQINHRKNLNLRTERMSL